MGSRAIEKKLYLLILLIFANLSIFYCQTIPVFIPDSRPPPVQENDYVDEILTDILDVSY